MIIFSILGALIGAGFASGQEIYLFFYQYGIWGILGLIICSILIALVIYKTFIIMLQNRDIKNYHDFLNYIFCIKENKIKNRYLNLSYISNIIINIFLLVTFYIMISGFGAYFQQEFNINHLIGSAVLAILCYLVLIKDLEAVTKVNSIIVPILIIIIVIISINNIQNIDLDPIRKNMNYEFIIQSIVYCSYNMILVVPVLVGLNRYIRSKKQIKTISIISAFIVFCLAISIYFLLINVDIDFSKLQMPAVYAISNKYSEFRLIYGIVILLSIFSTAISIGISFLKNIVKYKTSYPHIVSIMCISGILISNIGFANLVNRLFPAFGYVGILQIFCILKKQNNYN